MWTVFWLKPFVIYLSRKGVVAAQPSYELLPGSGAGEVEEMVMVGRRPSGLPGLCQILPRSDEPPTCGYGGSLTF